MRGLTARQLGLLVRVRDGEGCRPAVAFDRSDSEALLEQAAIGRIALIGGPMPVPTTPPTRAFRIKITPEGREAIRLAMLAGVDPS